MTAQLGLFDIELLVGVGATVPPPATRVRQPHEATNRSKKRENDEVNPIGRDREYRWSHGGVLAPDGHELRPFEFGRSGWCDPKKNQGPKAKGHATCAHSPGGPQHGGHYSPPMAVDVETGWVVGTIAGPFDGRDVWNCSCTCHGWAPDTAPRTDVRAAHTRGDTTTARGTA